jgi:MFS family permease
MSMAAMGIMIIDGIWFFIIGRVIYGASASVFFAAGGRYIEECSPPRFVSALVVCYSCGLAFGKTFVLVGVSFLPPEDASVEVLRETQTWRYFILLPTVLCLYCLLAVFLVIRSNPPMFLIRHQRDEEAKSAIMRMFNVKDSDPDDIVAYLQSNTATQTDKVSYRDACLSRRYRKTLLILISITVCMNTNGMYVIGSYGSVIYEKIYEADPVYTSVLT